MDKKCKFGCVGSSICKHLHQPTVEPTGEITVCSHGNKRCCYGFQTHPTPESPKEKEEVMNKLDPELLIFPPEDKVRLLFVKVNKPKITDWESKFDKKFKVGYQWKDNEFVNIAKWGDIKSFISRLLSKKEKEAYLGGNNGKIKKLEDSIKARNSGRIMLEEGRQIGIKEERERILCYIKENSDWVDGVEINYHHSLKSFLNNKTEEISGKPNKKEKFYCKLHSFTGTEAERETCPDCNSCEECGTFLGDSTVAMCKCGKYKW